MSLKYGPRPELWSCCIYASFIGIFTTESYVALSIKSYFLIWLRTWFLRCRESSGFSTGLNFVGLFTIPTSRALSSIVRSEGFLAKKVVEAALIPYALLPKKTAFIYILNISFFV
ncbi:MAG: hypothetical protein ACD_77C00379G0002 [uncultured bacterium]|nr:MAG: hypothetical protein ACD_77C00379G0002 [uncultured bacterium]